MMDIDVRQKALWVKDQVAILKREIAKAIVGHEEIVEGVLTCLLCGGHALLEGVPGLGKTTLIKSLGQVLDLSTSRIQFTPDLMPADIIGTNVLIQDEENRRIVRFQKGPVFAHIVLADEINRATPKTQSALLEAMQEQTVTAGGTTYRLEAPFIVLATQNPIEMEGTYPLPEAQLDRFFFKLALQYPSEAEVAQIIDRTTRRAEPILDKVMDSRTIAEIKDLIREVPIASHVRDYAIRLSMATRPGTTLATDLTNRYVRYGASPRGPQTLVLAAKARALFDGRMNASFEDVRAVCPQALRHRILLNFEGEAEGITAEQLVDEVVEKVTEVPGHSRDGGPRAAGPRAGGAAGAAGSAEGGPTHGGPAEGVPRAEGEAGEPAGGTGA
jgi:MoxR-like ATPase